MTQKYQNEKSPILNGQKKFKTSEKVQKLRDLEGPTSFRPFENTLYMYNYALDAIINLITLLSQEDTTSGVS